VRFSRTFVLTLIALAGLILPARGDDDVRRGYAIPAQHLDQALEDFSAVSGRQVIYDGAIDLQHRTSPGATGLMSSDAALQALLSGTGVTARYTPSGDIVLSLSGGNSLQRAALGTATLRLPSLHVESSAPAQDNRFRLYNQTLQMELMRVLRKRVPVFRDGFRAGVVLWLGETGIIERAELYHTTGDDARDATICDLFAGLAISQPPPDDMPEPVRVMIRYNTFGMLNASP
jgi:hypothetical protein